MKTKTSKTNNTKKMISKQAIKPAHKCPQKATNKPFQREQIGPRRNKPFRARIQTSDNLLNDNYPTAPLRGA